MKFYVFFIFTVEEKNLKLSFAAFYFAVFQTQQNRKIFMQ